LKKCSKEMYLSIEIILNGVADNSQHHQLNCPKVPICTSGLFTFQPELHSGFYLSADRQERHWANGLS
jgi:hypothetical protein